MRKLVVGSIVACALLAQYSCKKENTEEKSKTEEEEHREADKKVTDAKKLPDDESEQKPAGEDLKKPKKTELLREDLAGIEGHEVILSHVVLPPNFELPKHHHPGEEFLYVLDGSMTVWQEDKPDTKLEKGDSFTVPLEQVHTVFTTDEPVTGLAFRVHEKGKPIRFNIEDEK